MERVALYLQDSHDLRDGLDYVRYAEQRGFELVWQAESRLVRDAIVPMAAYAAVTTRIKIGSGVINNWTRNIGLLAATFLTLDDLAPNRIICGIGAWWIRLPATSAFIVTSLRQPCARPWTSCAGCSTWSASRFTVNFITSTASSWTSCTAVVSLGTFPS